VRGLALICSAVLLGCASQPPPQTPSPTERQGENDVKPNSLTSAECESLGQWIVDACHDHSNMDRSSQTEGWCGDMRHAAGEEGGTWMSDCTKHVKKIDAACFRSTTTIRSMMDCDTNVDRSQ